MTVQKLRLALLICDIPIPTVREQFGTYLDIFTSYLHNSLSATDRAGSIEFTLEGHDVVNGLYPKPEDLTGDNAFDGILITGSASSAHGPEPWIKALIKYVADVIDKVPDMKLVGICFGHQIIAMALGGQCLRNDKGWEVGSTIIELSEEGKRVFGRDLDKLDIIQMHRDHVPALPPSVALLGSSPKAPIQGMVSRFPSGDIHILTVQGHPEFNPDIVHKIIDAREASGVLDAETVKEARVRASQRDDGIGLIGRAVWQALLPAGPGDKISCR